MALASAESSASSSPATRLSALAERAARRRVLVQPSSDAFFEIPHLHGFKIGYAFLAAKEMQAAIGVIAEEIRRAL